MNPAQAYRDKETGLVGNYTPDFARFFPQLELVIDADNEPDEAPAEQATPVVEPASTPSDKKDN